MWTVTIKSKTIVNGLLRVVVEFSNGTENILDTYETRSEQDENWLQENIDRRIKYLDGVIAFAETIVVGEHAIKKGVAVSKVKATATAKDTYKAKLEEFGKMVEAIKKGIISDSHEDFVTTKQWLKDNWSKEYIDLF